MKIELTFRDNDARVVTHYLRRRYASKAKLERLAMMAVRTEVAAQAKIELDRAAAPAVKSAARGEAERRECPCCQKTVAAYIPRAGDGSGVRLRKHRNAAGGDCEGGIKML